MNVGEAKRERGAAPPGWLPLALVVLGVVAVHAGGIRQPFFADD